MPNATIRERLQGFLTSIEGLVGTIQFLLSAAAVFFVVSNEFVATSWPIPWLNMSWPHLQGLVRTSTWIVFLTVFIIYAIASGHLLKYMRAHLLELLVCLTWMPYYSGSLQQINSLLSLEMLTIIGSIAHSWRVARWAVQRFAQHPMIVITLTAAVMVGSASALLTQVEPKTFPDMWEAVWFCIVTIFTVGYGDITPKTPMGRLVTGVLIVAGVALAGVFIGFISKLVSSKLLEKQEDVNERLSKQLDQHNRLLQAVEEQLRKSNELHSALLDELKKRAPERSSADEKPTNGSQP